MDSKENIGLQMDYEEENKNVPFSFVLPAYKGRYLKEAIASILAQTYTGFELIIGQRRIAGRRIFDSFKLQRQPHKVL